MNRPWLTQYAPGVPADVDHARYPNAGALLEAACAEHAGKPAFAFMDRFLDFAEVGRLSAALGAWLQQTGLEPGARVALMMPNLPQYPIAIAAVLRAGYVVTNLNPLYTPRGKPSRSPADTTTTCRSAVRSSTPASAAAKFSSTTIASAPESRSWCSSSRGVYSGLRLVTT
jgi:acyl-CoA synthetase (AMP-forming)/AMP-acid ligase II